MDTKFPNEDERKKLIKMAKAKQLTPILVIALLGVASVIFLHLRQTSVTTNSTDCHNTCRHHLFVNKFCSAEKMSQVFFLGNASTW
jgi:hypothetical protein